MAAAPIAESVTLILGLQRTKEFLERERERVERETERYATLAQMASLSVKIISDTVAGWREAGHPPRNASTLRTLDVTLSPAEDDIGSARAPDQQSQSSQGQSRRSSKTNERAGR